MESVRTDLHEMCRLLAVAVADKSITWDDEARDKLGSVLSVLHRDRVELVYKAWIDECRAWVEQRGDTLEAAYGSLGDDDAAQANALDAGVTKVREQLQARLDTAAEQYASAFEVGAVDVPDVDLRKSLDNQLKQCAVRAFETSVAAPLNESLDERLKAAQESRPHPTKSPK